MQSGLLNSLILIPFLAAIFVIILPDAYRVSYKWIAVVAQAFSFINLISVIGAFNKSVSGYQLIDHYEWIRLPLGKTSLLSIDYILAVDGISLPFVILTSIVFIIGTLSSFSISKREKAYFSLFLILNATVLGCFMAIDFFLFFLFFEFMLLPMYFLIGIWGGPNKAYASLKFIIYTLIGSVLILVVMIALSMSNMDQFFSNEYKKTVFSFDFRLLADTSNLIKGSVLSIKEPMLLFGMKARSLMFLLLLLGFGIKLPMVPFHTWLPDAHVEAPTPISVVLAGILLKIGGYGLIRIGYGFFGDVVIEFSTAIGILGVISIIYAGLNALAQNDLKKLIAYSSVSHMGFVLVGVAALNIEGLSGAIFQMFSHGILSSMLFLIAGVLYDRTKNREIANFNGLAHKMPLFTVAVVIAFFGSMGLPSLSGFIGEFFSILGAFNSKLPKAVPYLAISGILLSAIYFLWTFQKMFFGDFWVKSEFSNAIYDLKQREILMFSILAIMTVILGLFPNLLFNFSNETIQNQLLIK